MSLFIYFYQCVRLYVACMCIMEGFCSDGVISNNRSCPKYFSINYTYDMRRYDNQTHIEKNIILIKHMTSNA